MIRHVVMIAPPTKGDSWIFDSNVVIYDGEIHMQVPDYFPWQNYTDNVVYCAEINDELDQSTFVVLKQNEDFQLRFIWSGWPAPEFVAALQAGNQQA